MRIDLPQARSRKLSLTSLIDVIFLLLLFFMLTSTFTKFGEVEIAPPGGNGKSSGKGPDIIISLVPDGLRINGQQATLDTAEAILAGFAQKGAKSVLILPKEKATAQDLVSAMETIRRVEGLSLTVAK
ncbi:ExbD/TolR family protein [Roseibium algae]|uniref:Biopolymer transporter ExbD n=1 Tax=Roseibium algae TaxID=3123038 RepID=A0ABU8TKD0_9HYPH